MATPTQRVTHARGKAASIRGMRGHGQAATSNISTASPSDTIPGDGVIDMSSSIKIRWNIDLTNTLVQFLSIHPADCRVLFNKGGKKSDNKGCPSGSDKTKIYVVIARCVFEKDGEYETLYSEGPAKFTQAMLNCLTYLRNKYKKLRGRFSETGAGVDPSQPNTSNNLLAMLFNFYLMNLSKIHLEQVVSEFPWYEALNDLWKNNPVYAPKTFSSAPGADHTSDMIALTSKCKGKHVPPPEAEDEMMETTDDPNPTPAIHPTPAPNLTTSAGHIMDDNHNMMDDDEWDTGLGGQEPHASGKHHFTSPSPPPTPPPTSRGTFKSHMDRTMSCSYTCSPLPSVASSSMGLSSTRAGLSSNQLTPPMQRQSGLYKKSNLSNQVQSDVGDVHEQVDSLVNGIQYIVYTAKAVKSKYKIMKVNSYTHKLDINFQHEQAGLECNEATAIHQRAQEVKSMEIQILEAQAKVHAEKKAALQLEIELLKLKGSLASN
ncbi:hypothetical protein C8R48DRAFT_775245 [Suillus tomentosus]|nr:hypothetical protein C8R48DRAFT_775245 [Suillus tomentosus]